MLSAILKNSAPPRARTIIRTILIAFGILVVAMWVAVGFSAVTARQRAMVDANVEFRNLMIAFREEVATILRGVEAQMSLIVERMRSEGDGFDIHAWGEKNVLISPGVAHATIVGPDGHLKSTTFDPPYATTYFGDREHFRIHLDGKFHGLFIGPTVVGRLTSGHPILPITRRVEAEDGTFLGVVDILVSPSALTTLHKFIDLGPHGVITLSGTDNLIRARFSADSPEGIVAIGRSIAGASRPDHFDEYSEGSFVQPGAMDGTTRLYSYGRVGAYPLVVTVGLDLDHALAESRSYAVTMIEIALGATLLLTGLAAYLIREIRIRAIQEVKLQAANVELTASTARAEAANRAKSQFLANMSHELRTPLNAIIGFSEMLAAGIPGKLNQKQDGYVANIREGGGFLLRVINDVLDLAQVDAGKLQLHEETDVELNRVAAACIALIRRAEHGGVVFEVHDTGPGMTPAEIEIALQPFGQVAGGLDRRHNGTGLGLPLARELAELHGGSLQVNSVTGRGTTVTVTLPAARVLAATALAGVVGQAA